MGPTRCWRVQVDHHRCVGGRHSVQLLPQMVRCHLHCLLSALVAASGSAPHGSQGRQAPHRLTGHDTRYRHQVCVNKRLSDNTRLCAYMVKTRQGIFGRCVGVSVECGVWSVEWGSCEAPILCTYLIHSVHLPHTSLFIGTLSCTRLTCVSKTLCDGWRNLSSWSTFILSWLGASNRNAIQCFVHIATRLA